MQPLTLSQVKFYQAVWHLFMATLVWQITPLSYFWVPEQVFEIDHVPTSVTWVYTLNVLYHGVLYFWDPVSNTRIRPYHLATAMLCPIFLLYGALGWTLTLVAFNFLADLYFFLTQTFGEEHTLVVQTMTKFHHVITLLLLGLSYTYHVWTWGLIVMYFHDVTDVSMFAIRLLRKSRHYSRPRELVVFFNVVVWWSYYRVYWFGWHVWRTLFDERTYVGPFIWKMCILGMTVLWTFNMYWTSLVIYKGIREIWYAKARDVHNE